MVRSHSAYVVAVLGAEVELQVAEHVGEDPAEQEDAGHRHDRLLADGGAVEAAIHDIGSDVSGGECGGAMVTGRHHIDEDDG